MSVVRRLVATEARQQRGNLARASLLAALVAASSVALLGLSGWFITGAALAGAAGSTAAAAFNYMLPSATIRLLAVIRTGARYGEALASHAAALGAVAGIRPEIFRGITGLPVQQALSVTRGEATARIVNDLTAIEHDLARRSARSGAGAALMAGTLLLLVSGPLAAGIVAVLFAALLLLAHAIARSLRLPMVTAQRETGMLKERLAQLAEAAPELRCYNLEGWAADEIQDRASRFMDAKLASADALAWLSLLQTGTIAVAAALTLWLAAPSGAPLAALAALAAAMTIDGAGPLLRGITAQPEVASAELRLDALLGRGEAPLIPSPTSDRPTLSLGKGQSWAPGSRIALIGKSGAGKTTLIESLLGLRPARPGIAWMDGVDIAFLPAGALRAAFAWLPQDAALVAGTVRDNLQLGNSRAVTADMWDALADVALADRVSALPGGLDHWIGENGERLSGGERRRLALARAYLRPAPWLLLDEPTESLDPETEAVIIAQLRKRVEARGQGVILASHRISPHTLCEAEVAVNSDCRRELSPSTYIESSKPSDRLLRGIPATDLAAED